MIKEKIIKTIEKYNLIENGDKIVLGVSGGPDSITMLNILNEIRLEGIIKFEIVVAHIHHGLRKNADIDEEYVKDFCKKINVECYILHANIIEKAKEDKKGIEETGRNIRYAFFDEIMKKTASNKIAIAHNNNDSVETVFMNIMRGSGIKGLKGIEPKNGRYIRPLIEIERSEIEEYCNDFNLKPRHDESNDENFYTRNKIRNIAIPYIKKEFNPNILKTINRLSELAKEESDYIEKKTQEAYRNICIEENILKENVYNNENKSTIILDLKRFNKEEKIIQKEIILLSIKKLFGTTTGIEKIHIEDIIKLCNKNIGNKFLTPNAKTKIVIKNKKIYVISLK